MTGIQFAATYLDPPSGILWAARVPMRDQAGGWPSKVRYHRGAAADALRSARRCRIMGMSDAQAIAATPAWMIRRLTQCSLAKDATGALIAPNILTDFQGMTGIELVPQ